MKVFGVVYLIVNLLNGKMYVGQTVQPLEVRFDQHSRADTVIGNAIRHYSKKNFRYGVIKSCASKAELDKWEKFFIAALRCKAPNGYNLTDGGEGAVGLKRTPEHNAKIAAAQKGKHLPPETCAKISLAVSGENNPNYGKPMSDEHRAKIAAAHVGKRHTNEARARMSVIKRGYSPFKNLLAELDAHQMSYASLAKLMGRSRVNISSKMLDQLNFTTRDKIKLEEIFGKPADYLLQRDEQ